MLYPAYIHQDKDGSASGSFPDVPGCYFAGDSLEEALNDAAGALDAHLELLTEKGQEIPKASSVMDRVKNNDPEYQDGMWASVLINTIKFMGKAERINVTLPHLLVEKIDKTVGKDPRYTSRSQFLAEAARKELARL